MKLAINLMMLLVVCVMAVPAFGAGGKKASAKFTEQVYDFGVIKENGGPVSHEFEFTNTGDGNLVILNATAECGCTQPEFPEAPVAPGKKSKLKVTYNPLARPGAFEKTVTIKTNGNPKKVRIKIRGTVVPGK